MEYYKLLQLEHEPFSNSPDPNYFFQSSQHLDCLQKIELAVRLKRGLNVVMGDMGTGKTTLCRELIRRLSQEETFETHLILDPAFDSPRELLSAIYAMLNSRPPNGRLSDLELKESIKKALFRKGVDRDITVVIIIDEGQKIPGDCVEILREFLNYETNEFKLLQIVIFAQKEFEAILQSHANFADRINLLHQLEPMGFKDTRRMIRHRIKLASTGARPLTLFTLPAQWTIFRSTHGYPRRIVHLCHQSLLAMIIQNRSRAGWRVIRSCKKRSLPSDRRRERRVLTFGLPAVVAMAVILVLATPFYRHHFKNDQNDQELFKVPTSDQPAMAGNAVPTASEPPIPQTVIKDHVAVHEPEAPANTFADDAVAAQSSTLSNPHEPKAAPDIQTALASDARSQDAAPGQPSASPAVESPQPPDQLGRLTIRAGDTISDFITRIYGQYRNDYVQAVLEANPHLVDPNNIQVGEAIILPAIDFKLKSTTSGIRWIVLDQRHDLADALERSVELSRQLKQAVRAMALWSPENGTFFDLLIQGYFKNEKSALAQKAILPSLFSQNARVLSGWNENTRLYSDPYAGGVRKTPNQ